QGAFWSRLGDFVTRRPRSSGALALLALLLLALNVANVRYTYNLLDSFPADSASRLGMEQLEAKYAPGQLAPTQVIVTSRAADFGAAQLGALADRLAQKPQVATASVGRSPRIVEAPGGGHAGTFNLTFKADPYGPAALNAIADLRTDEAALLDAAGLSSETSAVYFTGETAKAADERALNGRDTWVVVILVALVLTLMLGLQTRSAIAPLYMMGTILLSYGAALGLATFVFQHVFGYAVMSDRMPLYAFVFLVALGVDYSIMLMSRIREELAQHDTAEAVRRAVSRTGGVISSAGVILAATFAVLMTQSMRLLFMFGFTMAVGILLDTFLVRGVLIPAIVTVLDRWSFGWGVGPGASSETEAERSA
ncbi:MAG TPA: MMPL family transporter, partial [Limnochordia bacterium]|nr:MMPL family transporter [Limnochordia bacterium]